MKKKLLALVVIMAIACTFALTACGGAEANPAANLSVVVVDAKGAPVESASVTLGENKAKAKKTDANGAVTFKNQPVGNYMVKVTKDGYADMAGVVAIELGANLFGEVKVAKAETLIVGLSKTTATVTGKAVATVNGVNQPAAGVKLKLELTSGMQSGGFMNTLFETTAGTDGVYKFENLPEDADYTISGDYYTKDEAVFTSQNISGNTGTVSTPTANDIYYTGAYNQFYVTSGSTMTLAAKNSDVVISFSLPVDTAALTDNSVYISGVLFTRAWSADKKTLILKPAIGNWKNRGSFTISFTGIKSTSGISLYSSYVTVNLPVAAATPAITGFAAVAGNNTTDTLKYEWDNVADTTYTVSYRIDDNSFASGTYTTNTAYGKSSTNLSYVLSGMTAGQTLQIVVVATLDSSDIASTPSTVSVTKTAA